MKFGINESAPPIIQVNVEIFNHHLRQLCGDEIEESSIREKQEFEPAQESPVPTNPDETVCSVKVNDPL